MLQSFEPYTEHAKGHLKLNECCERLAQVGLHPGMAGHAGDLVDAARKGSVFAPIVRTGSGLQFFKILDRSHNRSVLVMNGNGADADRNLMPRFVVQKTVSLGGLRRLHGAGDGTIFAAEFTARLIAVQQGFRDAGATNDFVPQPSGNAFCPIAPQNNSLFQVDDAQPGRQAFEDAAADFRVVEKWRHAWSREYP